MTPKGVRVVRVSPGWVETQAAITLAERLAAQAGTDYEGGKQIIMKGLGGIPLGRPAKPKEVADLIAFLVSPRAASVGACAAFVEGWTATRDDLTAGRAQMRHGLDLLNIFAFVGLFKGAFAVAEARAGDYPAALATLDHAASVIERTGERWFDAELHRARGEVLVKQNPADPAPAEAAFLTAIAVAREQKARSFELRAALSLAKLYQSTGRHVEAHDILAPALEGFATTPEMPEIAEGQALLAALAEADAWKSAAGSRERRLKLQTGYGHAMAMSRGFASEEAKAAFARVRELATKADDTAERFAAPWGQWIGSIFRGELGLARETAEIFVRETTGEAWMTEAGVARRMLGLTCLHQGDLIDALAHLEEAATRARLSLPKRVSWMGSRLPHIRVPQGRWRSVFRRSLSIRISASLIMATSSRRADFCHGSILACFSSTGSSARP